MCKYKDNFLKQAKHKWSNIYDYSKMEYKNFDTKVKILCPIHGEFEQTPGNHLRYGCGKCGKTKGGEKQTSNTKEFIFKAKKVHGNKFNYSKIEYKRAKIKVKIICPIHGEFRQTPDGHLRGSGCKKCSGNDQYTTKEFIDKAISVHGNKFDYIKSVYKGMFKKVKIICPTHGEFEQTPKRHLSGSGCKRCAGFDKNNQDVVDEFKKIHGDLFDYSRVEFVNMKTKVEIICKKHGTFWQTPDNHIGKMTGCPNCNASAGERKIAKWLKENNITFEPQKTFIDCINPKTGKNLYYDFYIPSHNMLIEYDGEQHSRPMRFNKKTKPCKKEFLYLKYRDQIKNEYAKNNNIVLNRINHKKFKNLEKWINNLFFS